MSISHSQKRNPTFLVLLTLLPTAVTQATEPVKTVGNVAGKTIRLFNGRDLSGWYVYTEQTNNSNPGVFRVTNGMLHVSGGTDGVAYFGGLITKLSYENYRLTFEYKWGESTYGSRKTKARDSGVLLHCFGINGPSPWMNSYEFQIIEGGTGDLLVVPINGKDEFGKQVTLECTARVKSRGNEIYFHADGKPQTLTDDRLNWWGRDPDWKDSLGFRGRNDLDSPHGEWTKCEIHAHGDTLQYYVNGILANRVSDLTVTKGKIFLQTEGAEIWYRNIDLTFLEE